MIACQTAANEFLRQFWLAIYPPPSDLPTASAATPAQKAAKAAKMVGYLEQTGEKVNALVFSATQAGVDGAKIRTVRPYFVAFCVADWSRADTAPRR